MNNICSPHLEFKIQSGSYAWSSYIHFYSGENKRTKKMACFWTAVVVVLWAFQTRVRIFSSWYSSSGVRRTHSPQNVYASSEGSRGQGNTHLEKLLCMGYVSMIGSDLFLCLLFHIHIFTAINSNSTWILAHLMSLMDMCPLFTLEFDRYVSSIYSSFLLVMYTELEKSTGG